MVTEDIGVHILLVRVVYILYFGEKAFGSYSVVSLVKVLLLNEVQVRASIGF